MASIGVLLTVMVAAVNIWQPSLLVFLNHKTYDSLLRLVGRAQPSAQIAIVNVDEESLARVGQWPWPHYRLARLIQGIKDLGATAVAVDFLLSEPDRTSLSIIQEEMARELGVQIAISGVGPELRDNERALASALAGANAILGMKFVFEHSPLSPRGDCPLNPLQVVKRAQAPTLPATPSWFKAQGVVCNIPILARAVGSQGFMDVGLDSDGVLRRAPLLIEYQGHLYPSLALATYLRLRKVNQVVAHLSDLGAEALQIRENRIPVDASARLLINYRGPAGTFKQLSAWSILGGQVPREAIEGKVVLLGVSAAGLKDFLATPINTGTTGVEIQATLLDNLIQGDYLSSPAYTPGLELGLIGLCGLISTWLFARMGATANLGLAGGGSLLLVGLSAWSLKQHGLYWSPLWPALTLMANFSVLNLARFWREEQRVKSRTRQLAETVLALQGEIAERRLAEEARARSEERFRVLSEESPLGISVVDDNGRYEYINPAFQKMFGYSLADFSSGREWFRLAFPDPQYRREVIVAWLEHLSDGQEMSAKSSPFEVTCQDGGRKIIMFRPVALPLGKQFILYEDVTQRILAEHEMRRLEEELFQSQKLEALGVMAGGIAHDFNNVLQAISGYAQLMLHDQGIPGPSKTRLEHIEQSIQRAALMIRRLMTLARKAHARRERVDLNWEIKQAVSLLEHTLPKMVMISTALAPDLTPISGDPGQMEQILLNLATNAAHAMPHGGELTFSTCNVELGDEDLKVMPGLIPGPHARLEVRDTGTGMDDETRSHIFEPFFTTKPLDMGTGLGLSTVFSIISHHGGHIQCQSRPNHGTVFIIHLPSGPSGEATISATRKEPASMASGSETILVVDDEAAILGACREALEGEGYSVLTAESGEQALTIMEEATRAVDLIILDLSMPGMGGHKCLKAILSADPAAKVLIATGYADETVLERVGASGALGLIYKPYRLNDLILKVRELLDEWPR
ncbi:MAG: CHASE2 domain-containing protein [Pseudomonadota bacterium]